MESSRRARGELMQSSWKAHGELKESCRQRPHGERAHVCACGLAQQSNMRSGCCGSPCALTHIPTAFWHAAWHGGRWMAGSRKQPAGCHFWSGQVAVPTVQRIACKELPARDCLQCRCCADLQLLCARRGDGTEAVKRELEGLVERPQPEDADRRWRLVISPEALCRGSAVEACDTSKPFYCNQ
eukprot:355676-Chlamydomonas_euryale.AAC.3